MFVSSTREFMLLGLLPVSIWGRAGWLTDFHFCCKCFKHLGLKLFIVACSCAFTFPVLLHKRVLAKSKKKSYHVRPHTLPCFCDWPVDFQAAPLSDTTQALGSLAQSPILRGCPLGLHCVLGSRKVFAGVWEGPQIFCPFFSLLQSSWWAKLPSF